LPDPHTIISSAELRVNDVEPDKSISLAISYT